MRELDRIDNQILHELERDGRISNIDLADKVGLSPSACLRRVQELERSGIIKGYRAVVDRSAVGGGFTVYTAIGLAEHQKKALAEFERKLKATPQVRECHNITGSFEYMLRIEVEDLAAYKDFHMNVLTSLPFVRSITSYVVMESVKDVRG